MLFLQYRIKGLQQIKMAKIQNNNRQKSSNKFQNRKKNPSHNNRSSQKTYDLKIHSIQQLYDIAEEEYTHLKNKNQNDKWNQFISQKGTKKDKITFVAAQILKKPESCLQQFELLAKWTLDQNHNFALPACQALSNIYIEHIFTEKGMLKVFLQSVQEYIKLNKKDCTVAKGDLIGFYLEHHIKHFYGQLIRGLTQLLTSNITHIKKTATQILANMSRFKQLRRTVLSTLINKLGDSDMEVVNEVVKSLKNQFYEDIQASETLLQEAETFIFREHLGQKSQFYVINFLNNVNLKFFSQKSLVKLFQLFFHFFNKLMDKQTKQKSISSRLFLNSIKGLNKIFAFMKTGNKETMAVIQAKVELVYKTFHKTQNTKAKVQLLLFLFQSCTHLKGSISDRFYRILYEFISTNEINHCSISQMFFDLLLLSMKEDQNMNRTLAFIKRLLQLCFEAESNFIVTCLILINKVILQKQSIQIMMKQRENALEDVEQQHNQKDPNTEKTLPYDMNKRQPLYAGAQKTNLWQLMVFRNHYHPTVRKFVDHILKNEQIPYSGSNPLLELSLTSFVEKMSLKKQKKSDSWKIKVKRNLSKIRTSKYESMLQKPLDSFKQHQDYIKKYLQKRQMIHKNKKAMQPQDIQQFADQVIEKQMDRLNPKQDQFDDLSISQQDIEQDQADGQIQQQADQEPPQENLQAEQEDFDQDLQGDEQQLGDLQDGEKDEFQDKEFGEDYDQDLNQQQDFGDEMQQPQFDDQQGEQQMDQDEDMESGQKQFEDVFDDIGDQPEFKPKRKNKQINKHQNKKKFTAPVNHKKQAHKSMKKQYKNNSFNNKSKSKGKFNKKMKR